MKNKDIFLKYLPMNGDSNVLVNKQQKSANPLKAHQLINFMIFKNLGHFL